MDPLSSVIGLLRPRSTTVGATDVGGDVAIAFASHEGAGFYSVAAGQCWLSVQDDADPVLLCTGDCVVLTSDRPFTLASDLRLTPLPAEQVFDGRQNGSIAVLNGGGRCAMFAAHFEFEADASRFLLGLLPSILTIQDAHARTALRPALDQMIDELRRSEPGCDAIVEHLAQIALVKVLRFHLAEAAGERPGWLFALAYPQMRSILAAMHDDVSRAWTIEALAAIGAMSRTTFARRLGEPGARTSDVAVEMGYESEAAVNAAFKRVLGMPPRRYMNRVPRAKS